jgi:hypothetical protein
LYNYVIYAYDWFFVFNAFGGVRMNFTDMFSMICITLFLFMLSVNWKPAIKDEPGCFLDYRPGFKCLVFEKLP